MGICTADGTAGKGAVRVGLKTRGQTEMREILIRVEIRVIRVLALILNAAWGVLDHYNPHSLTQCETHLENSAQCYSSNVNKFARVPSRFAMHNYTPISTRPLFIFFSY